MTYWLTEQQTNRLTGWLTDWLTDWLPTMDDWLADWMTNCSPWKHSPLPGCLISPQVFSVDSACIVRANVQAGNGVIHVIPKVLVPAQKTIHGLISADPRFSTLQKLVNATSLRDELRNENASFTLFAPTDAAFEQLLDRSVLDSIGEFPDEVLGMLKDHVVRNALYTCGIHCKYSYWSLFSNRFSVFSLSRGVLRLQYRWNGHVLVNGIRLSQPDISATNGVVHVIDRVLQPNQLGARRKALQWVSHVLLSLALLTPALAKPVLALASELRMNFAFFTSKICPTQGVTAFSPIPQNFVSMELHQFQTPP